MEMLVSSKTIYFLLSFWFEFVFWIFDDAVVDKLREKKVGIQWLCCQSFELDNDKFPRLWHVASVSNVETNCEWLEALKFLTYMSMNCGCAMIKSHTSLPTHSKNTKTKNKRKKEWGREKENEERKREVEKYLHWHNRFLQQQVACRSWLPAIRPCILQWNNNEGCFVWRRSHLKETIFFGANSKPTNQRISKKTVSVCLICCWSDWKKKVSDFETSKECRNVTPIMK